MNPLGPPCAVLLAGRFCCVVPGTHYRAGHLVETSAVSACGTGRVGVFVPWGCGSKCGSWLLGIVMRLQKEVRKGTPLGTASFSLRRSTQLLAEFKLALVVWRVGLLFVCFPF